MHAAQLAAANEIIQRHLARIVELRSDALNPAGEFVLLWLHHAVRAQENPALDVAIALAHQLQKPLLIYQGLAGAHRYNSDRHHAFILQGARDVAPAFAARGIRYVFHLPQDGQSDAARTPSPLRTLFADAAAVVVEDFPVPPFPRWTKALQGFARGPVWAVDASCIVPLRWSKQRFDRAFSFRQACEHAWKSAIAQAYVEPDYVGGVFDGALPFTPFDLTAPLSAAIAACQIDHSIPPVHDTQGGSAAGYTRWNAFKIEGLSQYAARRNDADDDGVSRMSAYLHHGHVSALRLAREASAISSAGAAKFLDELLVWRELSYHWCARQRNLETLRALPAWAQETLAQHRYDPRVPEHTFEDFTRAKTGNALWDAAQISLLRQGELHNNVRMTWAKGIAQWARSPAHALRTLIDLNHRYALDGNNPNSYGGLLWALGLFDRPFSPEQPVLGTIRGRDVEAHARRIDMPRYQQKVARPQVLKQGRAALLDVLIVGAGMAGASAARALSDQGHRVQILDKARGAGGRMSTRRADTFQFDHGAQYFTARDARFRRWVLAWEARGVVARWQPKLVSIDAHGIQPKTDDRLQRFVAQPGQNALLKHLLSDLPQRFDTEVKRIERQAGIWRAFDAANAQIAQAEHLLLCVPAAQAAALLNAQPAALAYAHAADMQPCWAVMVAFHTPLAVPFDGAFVNDGALSWIARDSSKMGRPKAFDCWVLHATAAWSQAHIEDSAEQVCALLMQEFARITGVDGTPISVNAHRWRYALGSLDGRTADGHYFDYELQLGCAGDWCAGGRVEGAFLSGQALAGALMRGYPAGIIPHP
jgi:photolyase PhrII